MTKEQEQVLGEWAAISTEYSAAEELLDWISYTGIGQISLAFSRSDVLDRFFGVDRALLDDARRALIEECREL